MTYDPNVSDPRYPAQVSNQPVSKKAEIPAGALVDPIIIPGQPHGTHRFPAQLSAQLLEEPAAELTPEELAQVDTMYEELKPEATETARNYVLNRTPARYQEAMAAKIEADWPLPPAADETLTDSRMRDRESYRRPADQPEGVAGREANVNRDPNFNPNVDPRYPVQQPRP
jgi:hypothetical protein